MQNLPISDIVANLRSAFREKDFEDAELALIWREHRLKLEKTEMEAKYNGVLKEQSALKKQYKELERQKGEETNRRIGLEEKCLFYDVELEGFRKKIAGLEAEKEKSAPRRKGKPDDGGLLKKIKGLEEEKRKILQRAELAESRVREGKDEIAELWKKIEGVEEEKRDAERREREGKEENERLLEKVKGEAERKESELRVEVEKHLQKIECSKKKHEAVLAEAEEHRKAYLRFKGMVQPLLQMQSPGDAQPISQSPSDVGGTHPPNGLKRKRDSSGISSTAAAVDDGDDENITRRHKSKASVVLSNGSPLPLTPGYGTSSPSCMAAEKLAANASWQFEADMLAAFDKEPTWSMQAICALYRGQKSQSSNRRGFMGLDALRGVALAEFLLHGDPRGSMKRSVEELERHDPLGLDHCKRISLTHSKQLFEIYKSKEDPFFGPR